MREGSIGQLERVTNGDEFQSGFSELRAEKMIREVPWAANPLVRKLSYFSGQKSAFLKEVTGTGKWLFTN